MLFDRSNLPLCQVSMFNTSPISTKCDITVRTFKLLRHIIPLEEFDRNCLQLLYALFFRLIHISPTFSERDVVTALSYSDKNHFEASVSRKTNFKSRNWKWQRGHFRKLLEVAHFSFRDVTMAKIIGTNKLPSSPPPWSQHWCAILVFLCSQISWKVSACFASVTSVTACTGKFVHDAHTKPVREKIFHFVNGFTESGDEFAHPSRCAEDLNLLVDPLVNFCWKKFSFVTQ